MPFIFRQRLWGTLFLLWGILTSQIFLEKFPDRTFPPPLHNLIKEPLHLPQYAEAGYSHLGRSPVVDAVLSNPFYLPTYAQLIANHLKKAASAQSLCQLCTVSFKAAGIPLSSTVSPCHINSKLPLDKFVEAFDSPMSQFIYPLWQSFLQTAQETEQILSVITDEEKKWIQANAETFFFAQEGDAEYDFFTSESLMPLKFFEIGARLDLAKLADCARRLSSLVDILYAHREQFKDIDLKEDFTFEEQGLKLIISSKSQHTYSENADMFLCLNGNNTFNNNAGGTLNKHPTSYHTCMKGENTFSGRSFVQGCGCLGIGILANFGGENLFKATSYAQGAGFFSVGILANFAGKNRYTLDFFGQSCAAFGSSIVWDHDGDCRYTAHDGFAQAAASTLGVAFLD